MQLRFGETDPERFVWFAFRFKNAGLTEVHSFACYQRQETNMQLTIRGQMTSLYRYGSLSLWATYFSGLKSGLTTRISTFYTPFIPLIPELSCSSSKEIHLFGSIFIVLLSGTSEDVATFGSSFLCVSMKISCLRIIALHDSSSMLSFVFSLHRSSRFRALPMTMNHFVSDCPSVFIQ